MSRVFHVLHVACCMLHAVRCMRFVIYYVLYAAHCMPFAETRVLCCKPWAVSYKLYAICRIVLLTAYCALNSMQWTKSAIWSATTVG